MWNVARSGLFSASLGLACLGSAQELSEQDAVRLAVDYAKGFGHTPQGEPNVKLVERSPLGRKAPPRWEVSYDDVLVKLERSGLLSSYRWMGKFDPTMFPPRHATDDG